MKILQKKMYQWILKKNTLKVLNLYIICIHEYEFYNHFNLCCTFLHQYNKNENLKSNQRMTLQWTLSFSDAIYKVEILLLALVEQYIMNICYKKLILEK